MSIEIEVVAAGPPGPRGYTGNTGPQGIKGDKGDSGDLAELDVGTVTTGTPAEAQITGNLEDGYELNLVLPPVGDGSISDISIAADADIDPAKIAGTAVTQADTETVDSGMLTSEAAGDLFTGIGSGAVGILPAGANGLVLTTDDGETAGVKWSAYGIAALDIGTVDTGTAAATLTGNPEDGYELNLTLPPVGNDSITSAMIAADAVGTSEIAANAVGASEIDATYLPGGKNLWNKADVVEDFEVYGDGTFSAESNSAISGYIAVPPGAVALAVSGVTAYATSIVERKACFYDAGHTVVGSVDGTFLKTDTAHTYQVPAGAVYFAFSLYQRKTSGETISYDAVQVEVGQAATAYEAYTPVIDTISDVPLRSTPVDTEHSGSKNLWDKARLMVGFEVYGDGGFHAESNSACSEHIWIPPGVGSVTVSGLTAYTGDTGNRLLAFYDSGLSMAGPLREIDNSATSGTFAVPIDAAYMAFSIYQRKTSAETVDLDTIQVEAGSLATAYEAYAPMVTAVDGSAVRVPTPRTKGLSMLCFGDSITETATVSDDGATYTEWARNNWPVHAARRLQLGALWNYACSGGHVADFTTAIARQKASVQINSAIAQSRPADIIVYSFGANDSETLGDYATAMGKSTLGDLDLTKNYEALRWAFWKLRTTYPDAVCFAGLPIQNADREVVDDTIRAAIIAMAGRYGFHLIDGAKESGIVRDFEVWGSAGRDLYDGLHPDASGIAKMADLYAGRILSVMG